MTTETMAISAIVYCDAGYLMHSKLAGWGVHAYTFLPEEPKRGTGNPKVVPTELGYQFTDKAGSKVTVVNYHDLIGGNAVMGSNNEAELWALYEALKWMEEHPELKHVKIFSDSRFVVQGTTQWVDKWAKRGWVGSTGEPIKYRPTWEKVKNLYEKLKAHCDTLTLEWIKGHNGHPGNDRADTLATRGLALSQKKLGDIREERDAAGYWNQKSEVPRILQAPRWYFSTTEEDFVEEDTGHHVYYVGTHGTKDKEDDLPGKRYADNFLGVCLVTEPDPIMEALRKSAIKRDSVKRGRLMIGHLDSIFSARIYNEVRTYGTTFLLEGQERLDTVNSDKTPVLVEQTPVGLGFRKASVWQSLRKTLKNIRNGDKYFVLTDITDLIYEDKDTKGNRKLKPLVTQITKYIDVKPVFNLEKDNAEPKPYEAKVRLILGSDIISRNQLAALGPDVKSVKVVTWRESDKVGRYATMLELENGDVGLWARFESNIHYAIDRAKP